MKHVQAEARDLCVKVHPTRWARPRSIAPEPCLYCQAAAAHFSVRTQAEIDAALAPIQALANQWRRERGDGPAVKDARLRLEIALAESTNARGRQQ